MKPTKKIRRERTFTGSQLRKFINSMAEEITAGTDAIRGTLRGNTFSIHLEGASINITVNE